MENVLDEIKELAQPVSFECTVENNVITATVLAIIEHPIHPAYRVKFSDGHEDDFYIMEEGGAVGEKKNESVKYSKAISDDLHSFYGLVPDMAIGHFKWLIDETPANIWVKEFNIFNQHYFSVNYFGFSLCCLEGKKGAWQLKPGAYKDPMVTEDLIAYVGLFIDVELNP